MKCKPQGYNLPTTISAIAVTVQKSCEKSVPKFEAFVADYGAQERINQSDEKKKSSSELHIALFLGQSGQ